LIMADIADNANDRAQQFLDFALAQWAMCLVRRSRHRSLLLC
jgi:hypothetical protein